MLVQQNETEVRFDTASVESYRTFLAVKQLPVCRFIGHTARFPTEYAGRLGVSAAEAIAADYEPSSFLFDYQRDIAHIAIRKRKFAVFAKPGRGKTPIYFEFMLHAMRALDNERGCLILTPPMVVEQTIDEAKRFYGDRLPLEQVESGKLGQWLASCRGRFGVTNYEAFRKEVGRGELGAIVADEAHILASHYGKYARGCVELGRGLEWKLSGTGTPAPNDRIEFANQAVFLDRFPTVNSFLARYFVNRGQTNERWVLKRHALEAFYRELSDWCIFLDNPATYGWKDGTDAIPPMYIHIHDYELHPEQIVAVQKRTGQLYARRAGGITNRSTLSKIAKGLDGTPTYKYDFIKSLTDSWPDEATIIWAWYNDEQERLRQMYPNSASIEGRTKHAERMRLLHEFQAGRLNPLISKPDVLGYGLNLQIATRHIFSSLIDSERDFEQAVKRSNRIGSTRPLNVHIPVSDIERPMAENSLRKFARIEEDTRQQEAIFSKARRGEGIGELIAQMRLDLAEFVDDPEE